MLYSYFRYPFLFLLHKKCDFKLIAEPVPDENQRVQCLRELNPHRMGLNCTQTIGRVHDSLQNSHIALSTTLVDISEFLPVSSID